MNAKRRDLLRMLSGTLGLSLAGCKESKSTNRPPAIGVYEWSGIGFGIEMSMVIDDVDRETGEQLGRSCESTIAALEGAFSLYREDSELSRLNIEHELKRPSAMFLELLELSMELEELTMGYYQPAIHGVWQWLREHEFNVAAVDQAEWQLQCDAAKCRNISRDSDGAVRLLNPLTQLSMNAIGQGFLADCVAREVREAGVDSALLQLGETVAIGSHPAGRPWRLAVKGAGSAPSLVGEIDFQDAALAVSASDDSRPLMDPVGRRVLRNDRVVAVVSGRGAAFADAFATAFAVADEKDWVQLSQHLSLRKSAEESAKDSAERVMIWEGETIRFQF